MHAHDVGQPEPEHGRERDDVRREQPAHGTTSPFNSASRAVPMPEIASSSSIERNAPCCCRYATIFSAVTGPMPGSVSSCSAVAELSDTGPLAAAAPPPAPPATAPRTGTTICWPSATGAAKLTPLRPAFRASPPAAATAAATRDPGGRRTSPGRRTAPTTSTTSRLAATGTDDRGTTGSTCSGDAAPDALEWRHTTTSTTTASSAAAANRRAPTL